MRPTPGDHPRQTSSSRMMEAGTTRSRVWIRGLLALSLLKRSLEVFFQSSLQPLHGYQGLGIHNVTLPQRRPEIGQCQFDLLNIFVFRCSPASRRDAVGVANLGKIEEDALRTAAWLDIECCDWLQLDWC